MNVYVCDVLCLSHTNTHRHTAHTERARETLLIMTHFVYGYHRARACSLARSPPPPLQPGILSLRCAIAPDERFTWRFRSFVCSPELSFGASPPLLLRRCCPADSRATAPSIERKEIHAIQSSECAVRCLCQRAGAARNFAHVCSRRRRRRRRARINYVSAN